MLKRYAPDAGPKWSKWDGLRLAQADNAVDMWLGRLLFWLLCIDIVGVLILLLGPS